MTDPYAPPFAKTGGSTVSRTTPEDGARKAPAQDERSATYREVLAGGEYRTVFTANMLSLVGDYFAKAAITALVFSQTGSPGLSAVAFALSYAPWLIAGPVLATLAERYAYRNVMIVCDVARMGLVALVAVPGMPLWGMLVLLFLASLASPPAQAARSALLPQILPGDQLPVGTALNLTAGQMAQVGGYLVGGLLAAVSPRGALVFDAATFGASAILLTLWVRTRPPIVVSGEHHLIRETGEGFRMVFGSTTMRSIALLVFSAMLFTTVPEGLGAAWANQLDGVTPANRGLWQGLIMMSSPVGAALGALILTRALTPVRRRRLLLPFSLAIPAVLIPSLLQPGLLGVCVMSALCGFFAAGMLPTANALFVRVLPEGYRARAFGVMQMGLQLCQGGGIIAAGMLSNWRLQVPTAIGLWSVLGLILIITVAVTWPSRELFDRALAEAAPKPTTAQPVAAA
ncbi:MFS transporter [Hamadaea sp. NPDC050747]|uniref:MFS transporter n=1 Tax=Hamadaea sp. NPDC050747 TaxID=3155789 RepID=UPI0033C44386